MQKNHTLRYELLFHNIIVDLNSRKKDKDNLMFCPQSLKVIIQT